MSKENLYYGVRIGMTSATLSGDGLDADDIDYTEQETGKHLHITKNVAIIPSTYVMTHSRDYALLLNEIQLYKDFRRERE